MPEEQDMDSYYELFGKYKDQVKNSKYVAEMVAYLSKEKMTAIEQENFWVKFCEYFLTYQSGTPIDRQKFLMKINSYINDGPLNNRYMYLSSRAILEIFESEKGNKAFSN